MSCIGLPITCTICKEEFVSFLALEQHRTDVHGMFTFDIQKKSEVEKYKPVPVIFKCYFGSKTSGCLSPVSGMCSHSTTNHFNLRRPVINAQNDSNKNLAWPTIQVSPIKDTNRTRSMDKPSTQPSHDCVRDCRSEFHCTKEKPPCKGESSCKEEPSCHIYSQPTGQNRSPSQKIYTFHNVQMNA